MLPPNPAIYFRFIKIKELLFKTFSNDGKLDYVAMLLVLCKDNHSIMGLIKAISIITNQNIMVDEFDNSNSINERYSINLSIDTIYKIVMICLKNYKVIILNYYFFFLSKIVHNMHINRIQIIVTLKIW